MTPFAVWRARLPTTIGSWFARDLTNLALALVEGERVALRAVEPLRIEATVTPNGKSNGAPCDVTVEWTTGTGPLAIRPHCSACGGGACEHVVATLEAVRSETGSGRLNSDDVDLTWLPVDGAAPSLESRARSVWVVLSASDTGIINGSLVLDSPRLRGVVRDAASIGAMMDSTPADDWDTADRDLLRDDSIQEAFSGRSNPKMLARALFRLARHPRLRFDDEPALRRHPNELPPYRVDLRGLLLRASVGEGMFVPRLETVDKAIVPLGNARILEGPPLWFVTPGAAYLLDGSFDPQRVIDFHAAASGGGDARRITPAAIARVAPYLDERDRAALRITDASVVAFSARLSWRDGALNAVLTFKDGKSGAQAPFSVLGAIAPHGEGFVRFSHEAAAQIARRFTEVGFVPRSDGFALHGADRAANFVRDVLPEWDDFEREFDMSLGDVVSAGRGFQFGVAARRARDDQDWFELDISVFADDGERLTQTELATLLASNGRYADFRGRLLDVAALRERGTLLTELSDRKRTGFAALLALRDELHEGFTSVDLPPEVERLRDKLREFSGIEAVEAPAAVAGVLRGYQRRGLDFLAYLSAFEFGGVLADDMGTGKTLQVIAYLLRRKELEGSAPSLVIAPTSVTHTWQNEIARFAPDLRTIRLQSGSDRAARYKELAEYDVVITSYALARLDAATLEQFRFRALILDEAQNAKNPSSQIARVVRNLHAHHRLALTGTPVENALRDLWAIFAFVEPGVLGSESSFRKRFENPIAEGNETVAAALRSRLEPFVLRRTKEDVATELPERTEAVIECDLSPLQRRLYRGIAEAARRDVLAQMGSGGMESAAIHVLAALTRLRQVCAHPGLISDEYRKEPEASAKFDACFETIEEILSGGHRVLVFSAFASMLRIIRDQLDDRSITYGYLDGSTKDRDRQSEVENFMRDDGPPIFLCSLKAGGVGLTLTAADYVILYDPWWNPAVERQAIDRTHRIGQKRAVTAYRLVTVGTVEEKIRSLAQRKNELSKHVIKADSALAKTLTREDLELLFADPE